MTACISLKVLNNRAEIFASVSRLTMAYQLHSRCTSRTQPRKVDTEFWLTELYYKLGKGDNLKVKDQQCQIFGW